MNPVTFLAAVVLCVSIVQAQVSVCRSNLDQNIWVWRGNFARQKGNCNEIFHCSNGDPISIGVCPTMAKLYYSIETGTCAWEQVKNHFETIDCASETAKYDNTGIRERRKVACDKLIQAFGTGQGVTRLYAGDTADCSRYFNCQAEEGSEAFYSCTPGYYFSEADGECNMEGFPERSRCNSINFNY